jgi:hypothetical protein
MGSTKQVARQVEIFLIIVYLFVFFVCSSESLLHLYRVAQEGLHCSCRLQVICCLFDLILLTAPGCVHFESLQIFLNTTQSYTHIFSNVFGLFLCLNKIFAQISDASTLLVSKPCNVFFCLLLWIRICNTDGCILVSEGPPSSRLSKGRPFF